MIKSKRGIALLIVAAVVTGLSLISFTTPSVYSAFIASIKNTVNSYGAATIGLQEQSDINLDGDYLDAGETVKTTDSSTGSINATMINKYGGSTPIRPGLSTTTVVKMTNIGNLAAQSFTLTPGAFTVSGLDSGEASALNYITLKIDEGTTTIYYGPLKSLTSPIVLSNLPIGASQNYTFTVKVDDSAPSSTMGQSISSPLNWSLSTGAITQIGSLWFSPAAAYLNTCAVKFNGTLWCWGYNNSGQLGNTTNNGTANPNPSPAQVAGSWAATSVGQLATCGIKTDNTLWCWGHNYSGQLGNTTNNGTTNPNPTPAQIVG